ncbi:MAG TPA: DUF6599 family protein [Candidatus Aquilonibacter sp.]|jgi:hypothetical protein|nr:DUF6599 family protein [Candidatus Aquilonibacter sp.]
MRISKFADILIIFIFASAVFLSAAFASGQSSNSAAPPILPKQFAGWEIQGAAQASKDPAAADPTNAALLKEYGFTDFESATYKSDDGRTLKIRAARFADASGAFGAYTLYLQPEMTREEIGDQGASADRRVLFYRGHILVDAVFSQMSAMSAAGLRELAGALPRPSGNAGNLPPILAFMPHHGYAANTEKYAEGALGLTAMASPLPASLVDFSVSPEVVLGQYSTPSGAATLMLIEYPTPALAAEHLRRIDAANHAAQPQPGVEAVEKIGPFFDKRTGPIVAIAAGSLSASDAQTLLGAVNYEASVTWNENTYFDKKDNIANLLVNIILLCMIVGAISLAAGLAFGGGRILLRRYFPGRVFGRADQDEFISLDLSEPTARASADGRSIGPKGFKRS